ncbi:MAG: chromate efflux transporter [Candidatus Hydrogenedentes bacterium]|nr:chromate efflux transporter [Candidatus Hydrogenedentota bacterium]
MKAPAPAVRAEGPEHSIVLPTFGQATRTWAYIGLNSFGGPAGQIAVMHRVLVEEKRWVSEERFLHALNYCMLLPGPEAQQLATYIGWLLHGARGGLVAGTLFIVPGVAVIMILSYLYAGAQHVATVEALFFGLKAAVLAIVAEAVLRIGKRALKTRSSIGIAALAFVAIFFFNVSFPIIVAAAAAIGAAQRFLNRTAISSRMDPAESHAHSAVPTLWRSVKVVTVWCALWFVPLVAIAVARGFDDVYVDVGVFFSKAAVVTFGGAYSVLAYMTQQAVDVYGWLKPGEMVDGLAMAETTPGPLIMVVQFVGFMAAFRDPGGMHPMLAGTLGGLLATWVTFTPCFLWIFLGAPYIESLRGNKALNAALSAITAAVVGVVLNLAVWFFLHTVFGGVDAVRFGPLMLHVPDFGTIDWAALVLAAGAMIATFRYHAGMFKVLAACALCGIIVKLVL